MARNLMVVFLVFFCILLSGCAAASRPNFFSQSENIGEQMAERLRQEDARKEAMSATASAAATDDESAALATLRRRLDEAASAQRGADRAAMTTALLTDPRVSQMDLTPGFGTEPDQYTMIVGETMFLRIMVSYPDQDERDVKFTSYLAQRSQEEAEQAQAYERRSADDPLRAEWARVARLSEGTITANSGGIDTTEELLEATQWPLTTTHSEATRLAREQIK